MDPLAHPTCLRCGQALNESEAQHCPECDGVFCPACAEQFVTCQYCGRSYCGRCAEERFSIPSSRVICDACYTDFVEDTDFLFD